MKSAAVLSLVYYTVPEEKGGNNSENRSGRSGVNDGAKEDRGGVFLELVPLCLKL